MGFDRRTDDLKTSSLYIDPCSSHIFAPASIYYFYLMLSIPTSTSYLLLLPCTPTTSPTLGPGNLVGGEDLQDHRGIAGGQGGGPQSGHLLLYCS